MALTFTPLVDPNFQAPDFTLPAVQGYSFHLKQNLAAKPFLLVFMCNHCPYVKAIEDRLLDLSRDILKLGITTLAISSNDAVTHPEDGPEKLLARALEKNYPFPYLYDESQKVAQSYGAVCTPDFFLFKPDHKLFYRGRLDDNWKNSKEVQSRDLFLACQDLSKNKDLSFEPKPSMGCSIKWKT